MSTGLSPIVLDIHYDISKTIGVFREIFGERRVINLQENEEITDLSGVKYALVWQPQKALFDRMPDLEVLFSIGAGVDHVMNGRAVPNVPIVRFVDPSLTNRMSEWMCLHCLMHLRGQRINDARQRRNEWKQDEYPEARDVRVGIMGLGVLGLDAAKKLKGIGFDVAGWSRTKKHIEAMDTYDGGQLDDFLARTEILIGLLPATPETTGIFNRALFSRLVTKTPIGSPVFINAGRGASQVETDIVQCLEDGTLGGVSLDVFETEPLSSKSPLWQFENAILTPHSAAESVHSAVARHVLHQIGRHESGKPLEHVVDRKYGY